MDKATILADVDALDAAGAGVKTAHDTFSNLSEAQVEAANAVGVALAALNDAQKTESDALAKTISDLNELYGPPVDPAAGGPNMLMMASPGDGPAPNGPFAKLWAWIKANPDKALKLLAFLAALFGIPIPVLKAKIEAMKTK